MNYFPGGWNQGPWNFPGTVYVPVNTENKSDFDKTWKLMKKMKKEMEGAKKPEEKKEEKKTKEKVFTFLQTTAIFFALSPFVILANALVLYTVMRMFQIAGQ